MELPKGGLLGKCRGLLRQLREMRIPDHAANAGFFIILSVFPLLVLVIGILRYTSLDAWDLMAVVRDYLPDALEDFVEKIVTHAYAHTGTAVVSLSAVTALWSSSRGIHSILRGLNAVYGVREDRRWLNTRAISVFYTFVFILMLVLTLALNVFGETIREHLPSRSRFWALLEEIMDLRFSLMLLMQTAVFAAMFVFLPNKRNSFRGSLPGAVLASLGWQGFSALFSLYVEYWTRYSNIYGSMYAVALGMLWLYCCLSILFAGGALNKLLEQWDPPDPNL